MKRDRYLHLLLRILPSSFRERHGEELSALLEQMKRDLGPRPGALTLLRFYTVVTWDMVSEARGGDSRATPMGRPSVVSRVRELTGSAGQDLRYGARFLVRNKLFAAVAIGTLALGIGATTAIFSLLDATLLRSPAVRDPGSLVAVYTTGRRGEPRSSSSYPDFLDYRDRTQSLADLAAISSYQVSLGGDGAAGTELVPVEMVTGNYFALLGVPAAIGRLIQPADDAAGTGAPVAVMSWHLWRERFGADPAVVGSTVRLNGRPIEVVGVAPEAYRGLTLDRAPDLWVPMQTSVSLYSFRPRSGPRGTPG